MRLNHSFILGLACPRKSGDLRIRGAVSICDMDPRDKPWDDAKEDDAKEDDAKEDDAKEDDVVVSFISSICNVL